MPLNGGNHPSWDDIGIACVLAGIIMLAAGLILYFFPLP